MFLNYFDGLKLHEGQTELKASTNRPRELTIFFPIIGKTSVLVLK